MTDGLSQLEAQIKSLPDQEVLRSQLEVFRNVGNTTAERLAEFTKGKQELNALRQISGRPTLFQSELDRWQKLGINSSREIVRILKGPTPEQSQITPKLAALARMTAELRDRTAKEWRALCEAHQERAQTFKTLAERLDPEAAEKLREAATFMRPDVTPPPTEVSDIQTAIEARATMNRVMGSLQIEGPVERFLQSALQGTADASDLLDEQVQAYLNEHPSLWRSLKVVLK